MQLPMKPIVKLLFGLSILICACGNHVSADGASAHSEFSAPPDYNAVKAKIKSKQLELGKSYSSANATGKPAVVDQARKYLVKVINEEIFPAWMGTPWDFNGTTQVPKEGKIACGYFVTTVLRDAGFGVERVKLAQQASLKIIRVLTPKEQIKDYGGIDVPTLVERVKKMPDGLYVVGLDIHTGFILHQGSKVQFIQASYGNPAVVVREEAVASKILAQSKRFVLGRVDNDVLLAKWLRQEAIPTN